MFKSKDKESDEAAEFVDQEKVKLFELPDTRNTFLFVQEDGRVVANIRTVRGADVEDAKYFAEHHYPGATVTCMSTLLYEELARGNWNKEIEAARAAGISVTPTFVKLGNAVNGKCQSNGHIVAPRDPAKVNAYVEKLEAARHSRATTTTNSNVHPKLKSAIGVLEKVQKEIEDLRKEIASEQAAKISKMVAAREQPVYHNAEGVRVKP